MPVLCRAVFKYENDGQGKKIEAGEKGEEYEEFLALLGGRWYVCVCQGAQSVLVLDT